MLSQLTIITNRKPVIFHISQDAKNRLIESPIFINVEDDNKNLELDLSAYNYVSIFDFVSSLEIGQCSIHLSFEDRLLELHNIANFLGLKWLLFSTLEIMAINFRFYETVFSSWYQLDNEEKTKIVRICVDNNPNNATILTFPLVVPFLHPNEKREAYSLIFQENIPLFLDYINKRNIETLQSKGIEMDFYFTDRYIRSTVEFIADSLSVPQMLELGRYIDFLSVCPSSNITVENCIPVIEKIGMLLDVNTNNKPHSYIVLHIKNIFSAMFEIYDKIVEQNMETEFINTLVKWNLLSTFFKCQKSMRLDCENKSLEIDDIIEDGRISDEENIENKEIDTHVHDNSVENSSDKDDENNEDVMSDVEIEKCKCKYIREPTSLCDNMASTPYGYCNIHCKTLQGNRAKEDWERRIMAVKIPKVILPLHRKR